MTAWLDEETNGGEASARCPVCDRLDCAGHGDPELDEPETFTEARAFVVTASVGALEQMRRALRTRGMDTPGLDSLIAERKAR